jgi:hypothetical protein
MGESMTTKMTPPWTYAWEEKVPLPCLRRGTGKRYPDILTRTAVSLARSISLYGIQTRL